MKSYSDSHPIHEAIVFSAQAHRGAAAERIAHPFEVLQILTAMGAEQTVLLAGILHDTLEDTPVTREALAAAFGEEVAALVGSCSEDKRKSRRERMQQKIDRLSNGPREEKLLALADSIAEARGLMTARCRAEEPSAGDIPRALQAWHSAEMLRVLAELRRDRMLEPYWQELAGLHEALFGDLEGSFDPMLLGNERIEEAIGEYYRTQEQEALQYALERVQERMQEGGHLLLPVEYPDPDAAQYRMLTITLPNGLPAAAAFTGEKEIGRGPKTEAISYDIRAALEAVRDNTGLSALVLNPWGQSLVISKRLITAILGAGAV